MNMSLTDTLLSFHGRIRRSTWWIATFAFAFVYSFLLVAAITVFAMLGGMLMAAGSSDNGVVGGVAILIVVLVGLVGLVPAFWVGLALGVKRCHDRDKSGWFMAIYLIPIVGPIWGYIELGFMDGTQGPNQYGPSPKGIEGPGAPAAPNVYA